MRGNTEMNAIKLIAAAAICLSLSAPVSAGETQLSIAFNAPKKSAMDKAIKGFIKEANAVLAGKAKIVRFKGKKGGKNDKKIAKNLNIAKSCFKSCRNGIHWMKIERDRPPTCAK